MADSKCEKLFPANIFAGLLKHFPGSTPTKIERRSKVKARRRSNKRQKLATTKRKSPHRIQFHIARIRRYHLIDGKQWNPIINMHIDTEKNRKCFRMHAYTESHQSISKRTKLHSRNRRPCEKSLPISIIKTPQPMSFSMNGKIELKTAEWMSSFSCVGDAEKYI